MPGRREEFRDTNGQPAISMKDLARSVLYTEKANIVLPYLQFPMWRKTDERWSEHLKIDDLCKGENFLSFNPTNALKSGPLRHSFFFNGMDCMRNAQNEAADPLMDHVNKLIRTKQQFHRGFYSSMRGESNFLPVPFPRVFTPFALTEDGQIKPELSKAEKERKRQQDEFVISAPSLVKLAQDGAYLNRVEGAYKELRTIKAVTKIQLLKENTLEQDELAEIVHNLASLVEEYKQISFDSD